MVQYRYSLSTDKHKQPLCSMLIKITGERVLQKIIDAVQITVTIVGTLYLFDLFLYGVNVAL